VKETEQTHKGYRKATSGVHKYYITPSTRILVKGRLSAATKH